MNQFLVSSHPLDAFKSEAMHFRNMALPSAHFTLVTLVTLPFIRSSVICLASILQYKDISSGMRKLVMENRIFQATPADSGRHKKIS